MNDPKVTTLFAKLARDLSPVDGASEASSASSPNNIPRGLGVARRSSPVMSAISPKKSPASMVATCNGSPRFFAASVTTTCIFPNTTTNIEVPRSP